MHRTLELDEMLRLIARDLVDTDSNGTALALACSRKSLTTPVLDTMWEEGQTDFTTLLKTFPSSLWKVTGQTFEFCRDPSEEEWNRFDIYARRIRKLSFVTSPRTPIPSESAFSLLNRRFSRRCMFPNFLELEWFNEHWEPYLSHILPLVVAPSLQSVHLGLENASHTRMVLSALAPAYHSLRSIIITRCDSGLVQEFSTLLLKCVPHQLRFFIVDAPVSQTAFMKASQAQHLQFFEVKTVQAEMLGPHHDTRQCPKTMFPSLQCLFIRGLCSGSILLWSLPRINSTNLEGLLLELENVTAAREALHLKALRDLRPRGLHRTLTMLMIQCKADFSGLRVDQATIEHLLPLTQLTTLAISFVCGQNQCGHQLSDEDLERLVKAMPKLDSLSLGRRPCSIPANNSIKSLMAIAKHSKYLKELSIHTNVEAITRSSVPRSSLEDRALVGCPLRTITFGSCPIPNREQGVQAFTSTLLRLFPGLHSVGSPDRDPQWDSVSKVVVASRR